MEDKKELKQMNHVIDKWLGKIAGAFMIELYNNTLDFNYTYQDITVTLNVDLVRAGLQSCITDKFITDMGYKKGLKKAYELVPNMFTEVDLHKVNLTKIGRDFVIFMIHHAIDEHLKGNKPIFN